MDVRCEKCHTEYELEESKVTEAGVTVKCTSCGNLFKIKRRSAPQAPPRPADLPNDQSGMWLIRSPGGDHRRFRELTTLQQWIVERKVTRDCEISRSGETWKKLGEIAELSAFFAIVDQAQAVAKPAGDRRATMPFATAAVPPAKPPSVPLPPMPPMPPMGSEATVPMEQSRDNFAATALVPPRVKAPERPSWRGAAVTTPQESPSIANEPAWAGGSKGIDAPADLLDEIDEKDKRTFKVAPGSLGDFSDFDYQPRKQSRAWMFIAGAVLVAGGLGIWVLTRSPEAASNTQAPPAAPSAAPTAAAPAPAPTVPPPTVAPIVTPDAAAPAANDVAYQEGVAKLYEDTDDSFAAAEKAFEKARVADPVADARAGAMAALVNTSIAQYLLDDANLTKETRVASEAKAESARRLTRAERLVREALAKDPKSPEVHVALADLFRLQRRPTADVAEHLTAAGDGAETHYVRGMLLLGENKTAEAQASLEKAVEARVAQGGTHLRARYRLAQMALAAGKNDAAKEQLEGILQAQPQHARAKALLAKLNAPAAPPVAAAPAPAPATPPPATTSSGTPSPPPSGELGTGPIAAREYGGLVAKGDKYAENGDCGSAMRYYERALDARPGGVEALTGLGYCYLDRKDYARAISSFRAALGISSRYAEALIGIAEAYRFQGMKSEALSYYKRYLEQAPGGSRAEMARRQVAALSPSESEPAPAPAPEPAPAPSPAAPEPTPAAPPTERLPDRPGGAPPEPAPAPAPSEPAPSGDKLPDKPAPAPEPPPPPPPPAERGGDSAAPDSPGGTK